MKTTTILIPEGKTPVRMVDASYKVTVELNYSETTLLQGALEAYLETYRKLATDNAIDKSSELFEAIEKISASLQAGIRAFDVQKLIEQGNLKPGTVFIQS